MTGATRRAPDGLLPLGLFSRVHIAHAEGYVELVPAVPLTPVPRLPILFPTHKPKTTSLAAGPHGRTTRPLRHSAKPRRRKPSVNQHSHSSRIDRRTPPVPCQHPTSAPRASLPPMSTSAPAAAAEATRQDRHRTAVEATEQEIAPPAALPVLLREATASPAPKARRARRAAGEEGARPAARRPARGQERSPGQAVGRGATASGRPAPSGWSARAGQASHVRKARGARTIRVGARTAAGRA